MLQTAKAQRLLVVMIQGADLFKDKESIQRVFAIICPLSVFLSMYHLIPGPQTEKYQLASIKQ